MAKIILFPNLLVGMFLFGCISSGMSYIFCNLFDDNGLQISQGNKKEKYKEME